MRSKVLGLLVSALAGSACQGSGGTHDSADGTGGADDDGGDGGSADGPACEPQSESESMCSDGVDDDCDGAVDCADDECEAMACGEPGWMCMSGGCVADGVLPELPPLTNVRAKVHGAAVEISFDPFAGARDYRVYVFPAAEDVTASADGHLTVADATYRCAGNRMTIGAIQDNEQDPGSTAIRMLVDGVDIGGYTRTLPEATLGHVWVTPGDGRIPVYSLSDPDPSAENGCYGWNWYESRVKRWVTSEAERDDLVALGWRDNGVAFYVPAAGAGTTEIFVTDDWENRTLYFTGGPEAAAREGEASAFHVLSAATQDSVPLMRVHYLNACGRSHDELAADEGRFERAYYQGSTAPSFALHFSGLSAETTLVVEALDAACPFAGAFVGPSTAEGGDGTYAHVPWMTVDELRAESPTGEVYVNAQGDAGSQPIPVARSFVTVSPKPAPELDWGYGWTADDSLGARTSIECLANEPNDCGASDWEQSISGITTQFNSIAAPWYGAVEQLGELWVGIADLGAGTKFRLFPPTSAQMSADSYLYATMLVDSFTTARRYPQIIIAETSVSYPVGQNLDGANALVVQSFSDWPTQYQLSVCSHEIWEVNDQCRTYVDGRWLLDAANPDPHQPVAILPVPDFFERATGLDQSVRYEVYASTQRVYLFFDGQPYSCMTLPESGVPQGEVNVVFGDVLYHSGAETPHSEFLQSTDIGSSIRHFSNLGFRSGVPAPSWDEERLPCQPADWMFE